MEDSLQRVCSIILAAIIFFLLPLYMAFEKKDDIAYSLALKITSNFVDEICNKGYMTIDMYNDYVSDLSVTGNAYDISLEHVKKVYEPVIYGYNNNKQYTFDYNLYKKSVANGKIVLNNIEYSNLTLSYKVSDVRYSTDQILNIMDQDATKASNAIIDKVNSTYNDTTNKYEYDSVALTNLQKYNNISINNISPVSGLYRTAEGKTVYPMNVGDTFSIVIKNTNITIASILFNTLTFGANTGTNTKVYINYGGTIKNEEYRNTFIDTSVKE